MITFKDLQCCGRCVKVDCERFQCAAAVALFGWLHHVYMWGTRSDDCQFNLQMLVQPGDDPVSNAYSFLQMTDFFAESERLTETNMETFDSQKQILHEEPVWVVCQHFQQLTCSTSFEEVPFQIEVNNNKQISHILIIIKQFIMGWNRLPPWSHRL